MRTERSWLAGVALTAMLGLLLTGCGGASGGASGAAPDHAEPAPDSEECALALSAIGSSSRRLGGIGFSGNDTGELLDQLSRFAAAARQEAELLEGITLDGAALEDLMRSYAKMTRDVAEAADAMVQSVAQQNALGPELRRDPNAELQAHMAQLQRQQDAANEKLKRATALEAPLLERLNRLCSR